MPHMSYESEFTPNDLNPALTALAIAGGQSLISLAWAYRETEELKEERRTFEAKIAGELESLKIRAGLYGSALQARISLEHIKSDMLKAALSRITISNDALTQEKLFQLCNRILDHTVPAPKMEVNQ